MKLGRVLVGAALAAACYMPCMASSLDEALAVTADPYTAYTFYLGMDSTAIENTMDELTDWKKEKSSSGYTKYIDFSTIKYTRTLADGVEQELYFQQVKGEPLKEFKISFKTKTPGEAARMFYKAFQQLKAKYGNPTHHVSNVDGETIHYALENHIDLNIDYYKKSSKFVVDRIYVPPVAKSLQIKCGH